MTDSCAVRPQQSAIRYLEGVCARVLPVLTERADFATPYALPAIGDRAVGVGLSWLSIRL